MQYLNAFLTGGLLCVVGQLLIDRTKLTPARILVGYVCAGVLLGGLGIYRRIAAFGGAGATVPLTGFGYDLSQGVRTAVDQNGLIGAFSGGLTATAAGIAAAIVFALLAGLVFSSKDK